MFYNNEQYSVPQSMFFLSLFAVLSILSACNSMLGETKNTAELTFEKYLEVLKNADKCLEKEKPIYTQENTVFYELGTKKDSLILLVKTYVGCGYTGSCGDRILLIIGGQFQWSFCGLLDHVSDSLVHGGVKSFFLTNRGYQTGAIKHRYDWTGVDFDSKTISRNNIPWNILTQLPLDEACKSSNYDCFDVEEIELQEMSIGVKGEKGILISPRYTSIFKHSKNISGKEYWLFERKEKEEFRLLNKFQNIEAIRAIEKSTNGYYHIYTKETDSISYLTLKKEYVWDNILYVESSNYNNN